MSDVELTPAFTTRRDEAMGFLERMVSKGLGWARKYSLFTYPFATASEMLGMGDALGYVRPADFGRLSSGKLLPGVCAPSPGFAGGSLAPDRPSSGSCSECSGSNRPSDAPSSPGRIADGGGG